MVEKVPQGWELVEWQDVAFGFSSGATPYRVHPEYYKGNIKWVTSGELNYNVIFDTIEKITQEAKERTNLSILPVGTFLMAITGLEAAGTRGSCAILGTEATTNQSCMAILPTNRLDTKYLYHYYVYQGDSLAFKYCQGTKQQSYTGKIVKQLPILLPKSKQEQTTIAEALSDMDSLISSLEKLIAKKQSIKQGAMQEMLTGKKRLSGFSGEWENKTMGELFSFGGGYFASREQLTTNGYCYLHYGDIHGSNRTFVDVDSEYISIPKLDIPINKVTKDKLLEDGDVVFVDASEDDEGASKHIVVRNPNNKPFISGLHTIVSKSKDSTIDKKYRQFCFQTSDIKKQFKFYAVGTKVSGISRSNIVKIIIPIPPTLEEQTAIAQILSDIDEEIEKLTAKLNKYKAIKQGMMQELLTGKRRLV